MARRSYKTELGCIACSELGELGAAKPHWLVETPQLLYAIDTHSLILASRSTILLLSWSSDSSAAPPPLKIRPDLSPIDAESISALEWLAFRDHRIIIAGTSSGYVLFYSLHGELIYRQMIYPGRVLKLSSWNKERFDSRYLLRRILSYYVRCNCPF